MPTLSKKGNSRHVARSVALLVKQFAARAARLRILSARFKRGYPNSGGD